MPATAHARPKTKTKSHAASTSKKSRHAGHSRSLNTSRATTDHEQIRRWAEQRGAHPTTVKRTASAHEIGIIRLDFPGDTGENSLEEISWDEFFQKFDDADLALIYQEKTAGGKRSNFNKLVKRDSLRRKAANTNPLGR